MKKIQKSFSNADYFYLIDGVYHHKSTDVSKIYKRLEFLENNFHVVARMLSDSIDDLRKNTLKRY